MTHTRVTSLPHLNLAPFLLPQYINTKDKVSFPLHPHPPLLHPSLQLPIILLLLFWTNKTLLRHCSNKHSPFPLDLLHSPMYLLLLLHLRYQHTPHHSQLSNNNNLPGQLHPLLPAVFNPVWLIPFLLAMITRVKHSQLSPVVKLSMR